ncbi:galactitol-1-phosphate 5-dehydrogenase [Listeria fleischmannii]|uniref:galactitol-1-phosphate 5-dehydrogenase n=1 Tax=Listeria fleischmannii TaxID=1069827 RepID=UPI000254EFF6|nr:galactitol-1-phosphate 5-dehydrogenase [Listeria fleischmannii]EIA20495.1 alcohol dehydrogenase, zinc-dependent [Listeria fleischmannii subsp. coloradonensis]STY35852.1 Sorbitol dehydrogenase [Listeria fleischmannii subsp. coloradonensis]
MKALKLYGKRDLRYEEADMPVIEKPDEVLLKVKAVGVCGSDISRYSKLGPYISGMIWGHEFSGEVIDTGSEVTNVKKGDRIAGCPALYCGECEYCKKSEFARCEKLTVIGARHPGAYAEYIKLPSENVVKIPDELDYKAAAFVEPSAVVVHGYYHTNLQAGDDVVVVGAGNIGLLSIQWAKVFGARRVIVIDIDDAKLKEAKELGADFTINSLKENPLDVIPSYTDGLGADLVVEAAGSPITSAQVFAYAKKGGGVVFLGIPYADISIERFYFEKIVRSELTIWGSWNAISAPFPGKEWQTTVHFLANGQIRVKPMISHRLSLQKGPQVFEDIYHKKEFFGKVMFFPEN